MATDGHGDPPAPDLRTMKELCQPTLNGQGGPIARISIQAMNFRLQNDMIQQVQNSFQFHGLLGDDANKHLDTFDQMAKMFLRKYFPPSMVTKLRNKITNFRQHLDESLFEAWEHYKLSIARCPNHNMLPVTQIDTFYNRLTLRHHDTINATAGGTFMKRHLEECYDLIENMTANHNDWDTSVQWSELSSSIISSFDPEIVALKAEMEEINKNLMKVLQKNKQVKVVAHDYETYGGPYSYNDCSATVGQTQNVYVARAYNQGGNSYQPQGTRNLLSYRSDKYLGPQGFNQNQNQNNQNQNYQNQNRIQGNNHGIPAGNNHRRNQFFQRSSHGQNPPPAYQAPAYEAPGYQVLVHQASIPQPQVVTTFEFTNYMKANDTILKNMQTNMTSLTNSNLKLKNMFGQFMKMNTTSSSGSGTLPSNTITNPNEDLRVITTRSGNAYKGPMIPTTSSPQVVERETEVTKDTPVIAPVVEPVEAPVSALKPNPKPSVPYPSRLYDQKLRDKTNDQKEKFFKIFQDLNFNNSFADALILMPNPPQKVTRKTGDLGKFLIPCDFPRMDECLVLADFDASINLMPLSVWNKLSLPELSLTCKEAVTFNLDQTSRYSANYDAMSVNRIDLIDVAYEEYPLLRFSMSGNPTPSIKPIVSNSSSTLTPFEDKFLNDDPTSPPLPPQELKVIKPTTKNSPIDELPWVELKDLPPHLKYAFLKGDDKLPVIIAKDLKDEDKTALIKVLKSHKQALAWQLSDIKGGFSVIENEENELIPTRLVTDWRVCIDYPKLNHATRKDHFPLPFMDQMLERLEYYCFLDGFSGYFQIPIDPQDQEKTTFTCPYRTFAYHRMPFGLCNASDTFQRCMMAIFHDMIEKMMEVFMDDFSVFGNSFGTCLSHLDKMLKRREDINLCLNWEKIHFMLKEGIVLGHKISKNGIEVDKAKVDVIAKLPHPTTVKGIRSFLGHVGFY
nr:reverse transcriptase domain-containing protein [Tanacetum cinerariifolium]